MSMEIYYFSGTGNSLAVARDLAAATGAELIAIAAVMGRESLSSAAEAIGIVFPSYYETLGGVPLIVRRFVAKWRGLEGKYVFAACTYGSGTVAAFGTLNRLLKTRGGRLSARITVNMPENIYPEAAEGKHQTMYDTWKRHAAAAGAFVNSRKRGAFHAPNVLVGKAFRPLMLLIGRPALWLFRGGTIKQLQRGSGSDLRRAEALWPMMDNSFSATELCDACRVCVKVCPVGNIELVDRRPVWRHHCEYCLACFHWCPRQAIKSSALKSDKKYHHPEVALHDMLLRA
jgi:ferredoxin/flavodoxin